MSLASDYQRQFGWRDWPAVLQALPELRGQTVLDLGCGVGDQAALLVECGARVIGIDMNDELLSAARARGLPHVEFRNADLRTLPAPDAFGGLVDGLWCSFAAAYFTDLSPTLTSWARCLRPGGWIALTEVDDLFGHEPLRDRTRALFADYANDARAAGRYDFYMGRKLRGHLERCGFTITQELILRDQELSFDGPAAAEVIAGWRSRLDRMTLFQAHCGQEFDAVREDFLSCLTRVDHRSVARVCCCVARLNNGHP